MRITVLHSLGSLLMVLALNAWAVLDIEVTQGMDAAQPIAIVPFGGDSDKEEAMLTSIINADLARTGEFRLMNDKDMAQTPSQPAEVNFDYWRRVKKDAVLIGHMEKDGYNRYKVTINLYDVYQKDPKVPLLSKTFTVPLAAIRGLGHHISDVVYQKLTGHPGAFSTRIAYINTQWRNGKLSEYRLEVADSDGYDPRPLLVSPEPIMSPAWSPDASQLAYVSFENNRAQVYVADVATGKRRMVSNRPGINGAPAWSPDGSKLALVLSDQKVPKIYLLDLQSSTLDQMTTGYSLDTEPRWAPDGKYLYYTSNRGGKPQIYKINVRSKDITRVTYDGDYNARGTPTSDGKSIIMIHRENGQYQIAIQNLKTDMVSVLTQTKLDNSPSLSPNDRMIIYSTLDGGRRVLSAVSLDGRIKLRIPTRDGEVQDPAWSPYLSS